MSECEYAHVNMTAAGLMGPPGNMSDPAVAAAAAAQANATAHAAAMAAASRCFTKGEYVIESFSYSEVGSYYYYYWCIGPMDDCT